MTKQICLAQRVKANSKDNHVETFSIIERAPIRLKEHDEIWKTLQVAGKKSSVIDSNCPTEPFSASITETNAVDFSAVTSLIEKARENALDTEKKIVTSLLSKELDHCYDVQREWLQLRTLLSQATRGKNRSKRVLLLF